MKTVACYSIKGGVGKTACSVNLAYAAAAAGKRSLLIDLDPQGASSFYFRMRPSRKLKGKRFFTAADRVRRAIRGSDHDRLDVLPANLAFRKFDIKLAGLSGSRKRLGRLLTALSADYELVLLDCPPSITLLSENVFRAADLILVPLIPTTLSERTYEQLLSFFRDRDYPTDRLAPFFSMVQRSALHRDTMDRLRRAEPRFLDHSIPLSADIERMGLERSPVMDFAPGRPGARAYQALCEEVLDKLESL